MTNDDSTDETRRRSFLKATGALGAMGMAGLAGCSGGGGTPTPTEDSGGGGGGDDSDSGGGDDSDMEDTETEAEMQNPLELVHWWTAGGEQDALNALLEGFQEAYPNAEVTNNPAPGGAGSALDTVIRNRVLNNNPPSTFQVWPGQALLPYTDEDLLVDLDGNGVWSDAMKENYRQGVQDVAAPAGTLVSVPLNIHRLNNLFYNVSVVEDAGVDPSSISTPDDLTSAMETVESETDAVGMAMQTQAPWSTVQMWETIFIGQQGTDAFLDMLENGASAHEEGIKAALQTVLDYSEYYNEDAGSISWDQGNAKVVSGDAAFIHQGDWAAGQYRAQDGFEYGNDWEMVPFPGTDGVYSLVIDSFVMPVSNPSPATTRNFLSYCGTPDAQERFNPIKGSIMPRTDADQSVLGPFLQDQFDDFSNADSQPPTIAHGTGAPAEIKSGIEGAISAFLENENVDRTYSQIESAF
jgi:glucose/mannose transport system substrate-binding protein